MRLTDLEAEFIKRTREGDHDIYRVVDSIDQADGISFLCPLCFKANGGSVGTHGVICWRPRVPLTVTPGPGRWEFHGTSLGDLTLVAGSSSVQLTQGCRAHFFVRAGIVVPA